MVYVCTWDMGYVSQTVALCTWATMYTYSQRRLAIAKNLNKGLIAVAILARLRDDLSPTGSFPNILCCLISTSKLYCTGASGIETSSKGLCTRWLNHPVSRFHPRNSIPFLHALATYKSPQQCRGRCSRATHTGMSQRHPAEVNMDFCEAAAPAATPLAGELGYPFTYSE